MHPHRIGPFRSMDFPDVLSDISRTSKIEKRFAHKANVGVRQRVSIDSLQLLSTYRLQSLLLSVQSSNLGRRQRASGRCPNSWRIERTLYSRRSAVRALRIWEGSPAFRFLPLSGRFAVVVVADDAGCSGISAEDCSTIPIGSSSPARETVSSLIDMLGSDSGRMYECANLAA